MQKKWRPSMLFTYFHLNNDASLFSSFEDQLLLSRKAPLIVEIFLNKNIGTTWLVVDSRESLIEKKRGKASMTFF